MLLRECLAMAAAFAFLIFFPKGRLWRGCVLMITAAIIGISAGHGLSGVWRSFIAVPTSSPTVKTIIVVLQVGALGTLMGHYGVLDRLVSAFRSVFASTKAVMMLLPAAFGMLAVPGGAQLSSPFVNRLGAVIGLQVEKRAAVNLTFRHVNFFVLPTCTSILILSNLAPHINIYRLIALNVPFIALMLLTSYRLYLHGTSEHESDAPQAHRLAGVCDIAFYLSPVYMIPLLNGFFGLELYLCGFASLLLIFVFWGRSDLVDYAQTFWNGISAQTFVTLIGIYFVQNVIKNLEGLMSAFRWLFLHASGSAVLLVIAAAALFFGLSTGLSYVPLGILLPLLLGLGLPPNEELLYCFFLYTWSFLGYFFSPLHLCQVLTLHQMGGDIATLDRLYLPLMAEVAVSSFVLFSLYRLVL